MIYTQYLFASLTLTIGTHGIDIDIDIDIDTDIDIDIDIGIYIDIYFDIYIDIYITFINWRNVQSFYWTPFFKSTLMESYHKKLD